MSRRLALLSEQLAASREDAVPDVEQGVPMAAGAEWWDDHTRIAPARARRVPLRVVPAPDVDPEPSDPPPVPAVLPVPGRHAARRPGAWVDLVPATLRGGARLGPGPLAVVALLVAAALAVLAWQVVRAAPADPVPVGPPVATPVAEAPLVPATEPEPAPAPAAGGADGTVTVDVAGRVRRPGIVVLDAGARVVDALRRAGGARPRVDLTGLNLARVLVDGEQLLVGVPGAGGAALPAAPSGAPAGAPAALVDLNLADQAALETLPGVGPVTAAAIIAWRTDHGAFTAISELLEVSGIGDATLATLTPLVTV